MLISFLHDYYLYFHTENDYDVKVGTKEEYYGNKIDRPEIFPAYFKAVPGEDPRCCGYWFLCSREQVINALTGKIKDCKQLINEVENILKEIEKDS